MKTHVAFVTTLYGGIFEDAAIRWPDITTTMERDYSYLRSAFEHRGLSFFTMTLPDYGLWFVRSLDQGSLRPISEIPRGIRIRKGRPGVFQGVLSKVFDSDGMLRSNADPEAVLFFRTLCESLKKLEVPVSTSALKKTVKEFMDVEAHLPSSWPDTWDSDTPNWLPRRGHPLRGITPAVTGEQPDLFGCCHSPDVDLPWDTLFKLSRRVTSGLGTPDWDEIRPKHGPGAVSEPQRLWDSKYEFPHWPKKLGALFPYDWYATGSLDYDPETYPSEREPASRLRAVPKTVKGPRLICAEPISHQWIQQGILGWLEGKIKESPLGRSLSLRDQTNSQQWALEASRCGSHATLDLSAASDRLSTRLVEYIFQGSQLLDGMHACRTRVVEQTLEPSCERLSLLRKFATMGSALTFPIQSVVFVILSVWAKRLAEGRQDDWRNWEADFDQVRVYGDDIIVPAHAYGFTRLVLHECGLLVNDRKSFGGLGAFRESCGMDAFQGVDVTPPRYKQPYSGTPRSTAALVEYSNNLHKAGMWRTADKVLGFLPPQLRKLLVVGGPNDGGLGLFSFVGNDLHLRKKRWDGNLQREYAERIGFGSRVRHRSGRGRSGLSQFFAEDPASRRDAPSSGEFIEWKSGQPIPSRLEMRRLRVYQ